MNHSLKTLSVIALFGGLVACGGESEEVSTPEATPTALTHADEAAEVAEADEAGACTCDHGKAGETTWCESCSVGYHETEKFTCQGCYDAAQAGTTHAHDEAEGAQGAEGAEGEEGA